MANTACTTVQLGLANKVALDCTHPIVGGYTGRMLLFDYVDFEATFHATKKRLITSFISNNDRYIAIDNAGAVDPLTGSDKTRTTDTGFGMFKKVVSFKIPERGEGVNENVISPLNQSATGYVAVLEKKDASGKGSFEVRGYENPLRIAADGYTQSEYAEGGSAVITLETVELHPEYEFADPLGYAASLATFETLFNA